MLRSLAALIVALFTLFASGEAQAYPWMIQHQYNTCSQCHVDPSGGSAMTAYGRAQTEALLRSDYGKPVEDPGKIKDFAFGVVKLPKEVIAQVDVRGLLIPQPGNTRFLLMQSDLRGGVQTDKFIAYGSFGIVSEGALSARVIDADQTANAVVVPVARDYWVGFRPTRSLTIRAGRINLPFGIRGDDHIRFTRAVTRTTTNADQQLGVSTAFETRKVRGEVMAVAGNLQVSPDAFRERGYSGLVGWAPVKEVELGLSSLVLGSRNDILTLTRTTRQAHGVFVRASPVEKLALLAEADVLVTGSGSGIARTTSPGFLLDAQADWEAVRGLHLKAGGEFCDASTSEEGSLGRGWGAVQWFFAPHVNLRVDAMYGPVNCVIGSRVGGIALAQIHAFL
ncbi:MAG: hypothetical protein AAGA48_34665 [Myxococcota bacterium]